MDDASVPVTDVGPAMFSSEQVAEVDRHINYVH